MHPKDTVPVLRTKNLAGSGCGPLEPGLLGAEPYPGMGGTLALDCRSGAAGRLGW